MRREGEDPRSCRRYLLGGEPVKTFAIEEPHPLLDAVGEDDARHRGQGQATRCEWGGQHRHTVVERLGKLDAHTGTRDDRAEHHVAGSEHLDDVVGEAVRHDAWICDMHACAALAEEVNAQIACDARKHLLRQPSQGGTIGPPREVGEKTQLRCSLEPRSLPVR